MLDAIRQFMRPRSERTPPAIPPGQRVYAVGDIHGRLDLFTTLRGAIEVDTEARGAARTTIVLLGDLIDRGPHSAQVIAAAREWRERADVRILGGNHEEMFLLAFQDEEVFRRFWRFGGRETLMSYLPDPNVLASADIGEAHALWRSSIPQEDVAFVASLEESVAIGDYLFVHAGVRPGVAFEAQTTADLRWIREPFLSSRQPHGAVVVHGHTIVDEPAIRPNRIGIDTGAYMSGRLTALGLEGTSRWLIETRETDQGVVVETRDIAG